MLLVKQEINGDHRTVLDTVIESDEERTALLKEELVLQKDSVANADRLAEVFHFGPQTRGINLSRLQSACVRSARTVPKLVPSSSCSN